MRVSVIEEDEGYVVDPCAYRVTLDGFVLQGVVTADEDLGEVWVWDLETGEPRTKLRRGRVRVERVEVFEQSHPEGTVAFLDKADGYWTYCAPGDPDFEGCRRRATHFWDHLSKVWHDPRHVILS